MSMKDDARDEEEEEARAIELRRKLDARIAEADREERAALLGARGVEPQPEEPQQQEEAPLFDDDGVLDPAFVEVRTLQFELFGAGKGHPGHWVSTGRYLRSFRRRRPEDGTEPVVYARPKPQKGPPAGTKHEPDEGLDGLRTRVYKNGAEGPTAYHYNAARAFEVKAEESWLQRAGRFAGWSRTGR
jgi:hypothetical protein